MGGDANDHMWSLASPNDKFQNFTSPRLTTLHQMSLSVAGTTNYTVFICPAISFNVFAYPPVNLQGVPCNMFSDPCVLSSPS